MDRKEIEKIAKLIARGEDDASSENEARICLEKANEKMIRLNLTRDDIIRDGDEFNVEGIEYGRYFAYTSSNRIARWMHTLAMFCADFMRTVKVYNEKGNFERTSPEGARTFKNVMRPGSDTSNRFGFYGPSEDALGAVILYDKLQEVILTLAQARYGGYQSGSGLDYALGFVDGLRSKNIQAIKALANSNKETYSLILISEKTELAIKDRADEFLKAELGISLGKPGKLARRKKVDYNSRDVGREDGKNYDVDKPKPQKRNRLR